MPTDDDVLRMRRDMKLMFEAMGRQVDALETAAVAILIDAIDRMWTYACSRSYEEAHRLELRALQLKTLPDKVWEKLPASARLNALFLQTLLETDEFHDVIPGLFDQCWDLWIQLEFNTRPTAALELQLMLEDLPSQWSGIPKGVRTRLSRGLHLIQVRLEDRLRVEPASRRQAANGSSPVWRRASQRMIALCKHPQYQADVMAFSEAFIETRELYVQMGLYAATTTGGVPE